MASPLTSKPSNPQPLLRTASDRPYESRSAPLVAPIKPPAVATLSEWDTGHLSNALQSADDLAVGKLLATANQTRGAVALLADQLWESTLRVTGGALARSPRAARAELEAKCASVLLAHFEDPSFGVSPAARPSKRFIEIGLVLG